MSDVPARQRTLRLDDATDADLPAILALNQANVPHVGAIDAAKLARLHDAAFALRVARVGGEDGEGDADADDIGDDVADVADADNVAANIRGFLLAMTESAAYGSPNFRWFIARYPRFTYVDRIAVAEGWRGRGVGRRLYADLEALARAAGRGAGEPLACEVNLAPPNPGSMAFHERLGFVGVGERWDEGGGTGVRMMMKAIG